MSRRKALKTTISAGGLVTGLSTGALADDEDEDSVARGPPSNPGRGRPFAKPDVPDEWLTDDWRFDIPQEVLDEVDVEAYDARTKQQINGATARAVNPNEADLSTQQDAVSTLGGVEYTVTLVDETQNGFTLTIEAGIVADLAAGEANVSLTIDFNGFVFEFLSVGLTRGEGKNICLEPNPPKAVPLSITVCPIIRFKNNDKIKFGGSVDFCVGIDCPLPVDCEVCRGVGISQTVDL
jgi:hypothetical protein